MIAGVYLFDRVEYQRLEKKYLSDDFIVTDFVLEKIQDFISQIDDLRNKGCDDENLTLIGLKKSRVNRYLDIAYSDFQKMLEYKIGDRLTNNEGVFFYRSVFENDVNLLCSDLWFYPDKKIKFSKALESFVISERILDFLINEPFKFFFEHSNITKKYYLKKAFPAYNITKIDFQNEIDEIKLKKLLDFFEVMEDKKNMLCIDYY